MPTSPLLRKASPAKAQARGAAQGESLGLMRVLRIIAHDQSKKALKGRSGVM
jgi:hypothetical protein